MALSLQALAKKALGVFGLSKPEANAQPAEPAPVSGSSSLSFEAHGPQWGFAFWSLSNGDQARLREAGGSGLCLRIADVTSLNGASPAPHALQELPVDPRAGQWGVALPLGNRLYRAELGMRTSHGWVELVRSLPVMIPGFNDAPAPAPSFEPFAAPEAFDAPPAATASAAGPIASALHERMYQTATVRVRQLGRGSEVFHTLETLEGDHGGLHASGVGLWASGRNESGAGAVARQRSFWLVADAELIVYGATDPTATLRIGSEVVPLSADGSFRIQVPFRDGQQLYPIEAIAADGEQRRSIVLQFERTTPEDHTNPASAAVSEWF
jgi:hypothetical protein